METSCDNPFTTGARARRTYSVSKPIRLWRHLDSVLEKRMCVPVHVLLRQRIGILMMILFMPVNSPLWKMGFDELNFDLGLSGFDFFASSLVLFIAGAVMTFTPKTKFG